MPISYHKIVHALLATSSSHVRSAIASTKLWLFFTKNIIMPIVVAASSQRGYVEKDASLAQQVDNCSSIVAPTAVADEDSCAGSSVAVVHRKHKKINRSAAAAAAGTACSMASQDSEAGTEVPVPLAPVNPYRKPANPYVAYRNIKMKVNDLHLVAFSS